MGNTKLKNINEVNGWKVNHPHSAANFFYALFTFIYSAFPLVFLFIPLVSSFPIDFQTGITGLDIFKYFIEYLKNVFASLSTGAAIALPTNVDIDTIAGLVNPVLTEAVYYIFISLGGVLLLFMFFSVIKIILAIIHFSKGYLARAAAVKRIAVTEFIFSILFFLCFVFFFFAFRAQTHLDLFVWLTCIPLGASLFFVIFFSVFYDSSFKDSILEKDLELQNEEVSIEHISKVHEVNKVTHVQSSTIPQDITSIGGHAFSENQSLIVANIPLGIDKIGASAFANCLNLQVVSIPNTVKEIGFNCFFNCIELERINYAGTKAEWRKIKRGSNWLAKAKTTEVVCLDGTIIVNPYH